MGVVAVSRGKCALLAVSVLSVRIAFQRFIARVLKMPHIMIDLETLSTAHDAAIISLGAVLFDPQKNQLGNEFYRVIKLSNQSADGVIDADTMSWWMKQSNEARAVFWDKNAIYLQEALIDFSDFVERYCGQDAQVWGNGATFDNIILGSAYRRHELRQPWNFRNDRDVRTVVELGRTLRNIDPKRSGTIEGIAHHALDDARFQAQYICTIYEALARQ